MNPSKIIPRTRLVVADDHVLVLGGLAKLLEEKFQIVATANDGRQVLEVCQQLKPDVVLLDITMPLLNGIETARQLSRTLPEIKIVFVTVHSDAEYVREAFRAGAQGYVLKRSAPSELITAIRTVVSGGRYITPLVSQYIAESLEKQPSETDKAILTTRQREVLRLVAEGRTAKEIAALLGITTKTVEFHKSSIEVRLGLHSTAELIRYALEHDLLRTAADRS